MEESEHEPYVPECEEVNQILDNLYLGSMAAAQDLDTLIKYSKFM